MNEIEPIASGQRTSSSDMLTALQNLEQMFQVCRLCTNQVASDSVLMGMALEAQTLALKMKTMLARWNRYLPFHEVMDVKFDHWGQKVGEWIEALEPAPSEEMEAKYAWMEPCHEYMLDLYAQTDRTHADGSMQERDPHFYTAGSDMETYHEQVSAYMARMKELRIRMKEEECAEEGVGWREEVSNMAGYTLMEAYVAQLLKEHPRISESEFAAQMVTNIKADFGAWMSFGNTREIALLALHLLHEQLEGLQDLFCKELPAEMFIRLSHRLFTLHCVCSYNAGATQVNKWKNWWPEALQKQNAEAKKEELKKQLLGMPYGQELQEYISLDAPNLFSSSNFGRFLFAKRHELLVRDVQYIHRVCHELNLLNRLIGHGGEEVQTHAAPIRQLDEAEQKILQAVMQLTRKACWVGIEKDEAVKAMHKALGMGEALACPELELLSQKLWALLKKRRGCTEEGKSLKVTWLNLVGYWRNKGLLSGTSPALTKHFFPFCGTKDYTAIDKGSSLENLNFSELTPLLDACFDVKSARKC